MNCVDTMHLDFEPSKRQQRNTLETTVISRNDDLKREWEWWTSLAVSVMGESKLLSARDDPRDVGSGRSHEAFSELIIHHVQLLSTLSSNTFTLCHAAGLPAYPSSRVTRKRMQWWQKVADAVVKSGVTLRVKGEDADVERGQHICRFASEIHRYAKSLSLD
ncbi:hypothetical protein BDV97DRAFT_106256 [Delphinella strobiligena]|nr:hypothetical protein BDV97DRAFT_106256 [Delphinella strobiligena]